MNPPAHEASPAAEPRPQPPSGPQAEQRRALFSYLTAGSFDDYVSVMELFTSTLLADLSASDVADQLADLGIDMPADLAEERCQQLVTWGNLVRSVRDTRVPTIAAYHRSRARYQVSKLGGRLHRQASEILRTADGAREVARELLARIADTLRDIGVLAANPHREVDQEALAGAVTSVFNDHRLFTSSVTDFYAYLSGVLTRYDLAGEEYARFKELLLSYVELISADVNRNSPVIVERLTTLLNMIDLVIDNLPAGPDDDTGLLHLERLPGRTALGVGTARRLVRRDLGPLRARTAAGRRTTGCRAAARKRETHGRSARHRRLAPRGHAETCRLVRDRRHRQRAPPVRCGVRRVPVPAPAPRPGRARRSRRRDPVVVGIGPGRRAGLATRTGRPGRSRADLPRPGPGPGPGTAAVRRGGTLSTPPGRGP